MKKIDVVVPVKDRRDSIKKYLKVLYQFHKLTDKEIRLLTELIYFFKEYEQAHGVAVAMKLLFDPDTKKLIRKNVDDMTDGDFQNYLTKFRKKKVINGRTISALFIPPADEFELTVKFNSNK